MRRLRVILATAIRRFRVPATVTLVVIALVGASIMVLRSGSDGDSSTDLGDGEVGIVVSTEMREIIGNSPAVLQLGSTRLEKIRDKSIIRGTKGVTGLVALTVNDIPVGLVIAPKTGALALNTPIDFRSTAVAEILLTPGILTGDGLVDSLTLAVAHSIDATDRLADALRREASDEGTLFLRDLEESTDQLVNEAAAELLDRVGATLGNIDFTQPSTEPLLPESSASAKEMTLLSVGPNRGSGSTSTAERPELGPMCDIGVSNYTGLEHDNICFSLINGPVEDTERLFRLAVENRSPRWATVHLNQSGAGIASLASGDISTVAERTDRVVPDAVIAPKRWALPGVLDLVGRFGKALGDSSTANSAKSILNVIPGVKLRSSDDSFAEQLELKFREFSQNMRMELELPLSTHTRLTTVAAGFPRQDGYSGYLSTTFPDEIRRLVVTTATLLTEIVTPVVRIILDLKRPGQEEAKCAYEQKVRSTNQFNELTKFAVENSESIAPFATAVLGSSTDSYIEGIASTAPAAMKAIISSPVPWNLIGTSLFPSCDKAEPVKDVSDAAAMLSQVGLDPKNAEQIVIEYASDQIVSKLKDSVKDAVVKHLATMWTGWGAVVKVAEAAPEIANFFLGLAELTRETWTFDTEDAYFFVDSEGKALAAPPWPQESWNFQMLSGGEPEIRRRDDGTFTVGNGRELVLIDPSNGGVKRRYVLGSDLSAYDGAGALLWKSGWISGITRSIRQLTIQEDPVVSADMLFSSDTYIYDKMTGAERIQLDSAYIGKSIWSFGGGYITIHDPVTLQVTARVAEPVAGARPLIRIGFDPAESATMIGDYGAMASIDSAGRTQLLNTGGVTPDAKTFIWSEKDLEGCLGTTFRRDGRLVNLDQKGQENWSFPSATSDTVTAWEGSADCTFFVGDDDGRIWRLDKYGKNQWGTAGVRLTDRLSAVTKILGTSGHLYVGSADERDLFALDPSDGSLLWRLMLPSPIHDMSAGEDFILISLKDGSVRRLDQNYTKKLSS